MVHASTLLPQLDVNVVPAPCAVLDASPGAHAADVPAGFGRSVDLGSVCAVRYARAHAAACTKAAHLLCSQLSDSYGIVTYVEEQEGGSAEALGAHWGDLEARPASCSPADLRVGLAGDICGLDEPDAQQSRGVSQGSRALVDAAGGANGLWPDAARATPASHRDALTASSLELMLLPEQTLEALLSPFVPEDHVMREG